MHELLGQGKSRWPATARNGAKNSSGRAFFEQNAAISKLLRPRTSGGINSETETALTWLAAAPTTQKLFGQLAETVNQVQDSVDAVGSQPEQQEEGSFGGYTQCDFLDKHISYEAQYALYYMYKQGGTERSDALSMLGAVRSGEMQGIYKEDERRPALMARRHDTYWWRLIPSGQNASVYEANVPPMMVFKDRVAGHRAVLANALFKAWKASSLGHVHHSIPPPSNKSCPILIKVPEQIFVPEQIIIGGKKPPGRNPPQNGCDKAALSKKVDSCINWTKLRVQECNATVFVCIAKCKMVPWCVAKCMASYWVCLDRARKRLLDCDARVKEETNCGPHKHPPPRESGPPIA